ncbi:MAG: phosphoenolpyruvate carboxykinase [Candidatus Omnitrophica bacterium]|nr:phosphoenolpyruvate carboxykinase [Candidatus Omnitrophota bacterium]
MNTETFEISENKVIIKLNERICETPGEVLASPLFRAVLERVIDKLVRRDSFLAGIFERRPVAGETVALFIKTLGALVHTPVQSAGQVVPGAGQFLKDPALFNEFIEYVYNYWRSFDRFLIANDHGQDWDQKPYRTFNATIGQLTGLIRGMYRDIQENVTGIHPRIYRQVAAGAEVSSITALKEVQFPAPVYEKLNAVPVIRQILIYPPLILNPPMNKRTGKFERVQKNPLELFDFNPGEWLCYPAKVGSLIILVYFHNRFSELGHSLCNLFEMAEDEDLARKPDGVYAFGVPGGALDGFGAFPTVFYDDEKNGVLVGAVPGRNEFGYFGYLKKMVLTLHNIIMMKRGKLPFHGAFVRILLKGGQDVKVLFVGDTGAGKSETLEALREFGETSIQDLIVIADDMGSLEIRREGVVGYGTETGAFLRLDDLPPGYALGQIDRAIIMSPNQVNARIILPVTTFANVIKGHPVDFILYANNYEDIDEDHPVMEFFPNPEQALGVFREGTVMSKGTTTTTGIVHNYFANVFGPVQYRDLHEALARKFFQAFFKHNIPVGQIRTRLGLAGWERNGPREASRELLDLIQKSSR